MNPAIKRDFAKIQTCYKVLFETYLEQVTKMVSTSEIFTEMLNSMNPAYVEIHAPAAIARDFIAGMTDDYFLKVASLYGCSIPKKI
jgi:dGTPase